MNYSQPAENRLSIRYFRCEACDHVFSAKVGTYEAGICRKCGDTEWVIRSGERPSFSPEDITQWSD